MSFLQFLIKEQISKLETELNECQQLISLLNELPKTYSKQIIAPINSVCMQPIKLIHTNELLVKIGDYYIERSATQAIQITERKIIYIKEKIKKLQTQQNELQNNKDQEKPIINKTQDNYFEIVETLEESEKREQEITNSRLPQKQPSSQQDGKLILNGVPFEQTETYKIFQQFNQHPKEKESSDEEPQTKEKSQQINEFKKIGQKVNFEIPQVFSTEKTEQINKLEEQNKKVSRFKQERMKLKQQFEQ